MASLLLWGSKKLKRLALGERLVRRHPLHYAMALRNFRSFAEADLTERRRLLQGRLAEVLRAASRTQHGRKVGAPRELERWPLLDKAAVRAGSRAFWAGRGWLAGRAMTSGTTGPPLELLRSTASVAYEQAAVDSVVARLGVHPERARVAVLRGEVVTPYNGACWAISMNGRRLTVSSYHLTRATIDAYADALREFRPDVLFAYPSALDSFCHLLAAAGRTLEIPRVVCSSEVLHAGTWTLARETLGCAMADHYGQAERVAFAYATMPGEYRFLPGYAFVELLRMEGDATQTLYEIVGTALWNLSMPLVRYRTGDILRLPTALGTQELEEITLGLRAFPGIVGRNADVLLLPDGPRLVAINHIPRDLTRIAALQIVQETPEHVRIRVLPGPRYDAAEAESFLARARTVLPVSVSVTLEPTDQLERGQLGKIPVIVHRPAVTQALTQMPPLAAATPDAGQAGTPVPR